MVKPEGDEDSFPFSTKTGRKQTTSAQFQTFHHNHNNCLLHLSVVVAESLITKQCMRSDMCDQVYSDGVRCCAEDLCNGAKHTGVFVPLLVAPVAIITLMI